MARTASPKAMATGLRTTCALRLLLLLALLALPSAAQAQSYTNQYGVWTYTTNNTGTITITSYVGPGGDVAVPDSIPETITGLAVTEVGDYAFNACYTLTNVTFPDTTTSIGIEAFAYCSRLAGAVLPETVTNIGESAFNSCFSLTSMAIPASVVSIGGGAFYECTSLTAITVDASNSAYGSLDAVLFDKGQTLIIQYPPSKAGSEYTIPDTVRIIGGSAFAWCTGLQSVTIPSNVTSIGDDAFGYCSVTNANIPSRLLNKGIISSAAL